MFFELLSEDNVFIAGSNGMVGSAIKREFTKLGFKEKALKGKLLTPSRKELNLLNYEDVENWFNKNNPSIVIIAAAKVIKNMRHPSQPITLL